MLGGIGTWEILLIFLVILLMFGAKRIPEIAKGLGKGITEFKKAVRDVQDEIQTGVEDTPPSDQAQNTQPSNKADKEKTAQS
ncbi:MAG: twin-arginine translocase TatA/TatE family subunit [bacterium]|nr:twin-arginine translocase TatA/TatE family subunit [bacterium]